MKKIVTAIPLAFYCSLLSAQNKNVDDNSNDYLLWSSVIAAAIAVTGFLVYRFFKSTEEKKEHLIPIIKKISPNPSHGPVSIQIEGRATLLKIFNMNDQPLGSFAIIGGEVQFDLSSSPRGNYILVAYYGATRSNAMQLTLE